MHKNNSILAEKQKNFKNPQQGVILYVFTLVY